MQTCCIWICVCAFLPPSPARRRRDSQTSIDSVDTVEGVSLAFQEIISAAEEAMAAEGWMEGIPPVKQRGLPGVHWVVLLWGWVYQGAQFCK